MSTSTPQARQRRGAVILEFIIVFPAVFIATLAVFQFGILALVMQTGTTAAIEGARKGAAFYPSGMDENDIAEEIVARINSILDLHGLKITDDPATSTATVSIKRGIQTQVNKGNISNYPPAYDFPTLSPADDEVILTLCFPLVSNPAPGHYGSPVPNWLASYGFSFTGSKFQMTAVASLE
ncbi:MAG TPA: TadE family protein [Planctomicrobium sp.]|nr:TadE family protein [Planctomicrobium sp.]